MSDIASRTPIACENCRRTKRKCAPPYPCHGCTKAEVDCVVRGKARPQRSAKSAQASVSPSTGQSRKTTPNSGSLQITASVTVQVQGSISPPVLDACNVIRELVISETGDSAYLDRVCDLTEPVPKSMQPVANAGYEFTSRISSALSTIPLADMEAMIEVVCDGFLTQVGILDLDLLKILATEFLLHSPFASTLGEANLFPCGMSLDRAGLLFAALALSTYTNSDQAIFQSLLDLSTWMTDNYICEPTVELVSTLVAQHVCALRTDTTEAAQRLTKRAIDAAHELGMHIPVVNCRLQTLRLYMSLCLGDQYCAISNNTIPYITEIAPDLFKPLLVESPQLRSLIWLIALNGQVIQKLHSTPGTIENTTHLESAASKVFSSIAKLRPDEWHDTTNVELHFEIMLQGHTFWSRIMLRAPWIEPVSSRATSLAICVRAASMLLSIYFGTFKSSIAVIASTCRPTPDGPTARKLQSISILPPTWPQVRRTVTSAFLLLYAFRKGEATHDECARSCATALLMLEYQRTRFGADVDPPAASIRRLAREYGIALRPSICEKVPSIDADFLDLVSGAPESTQPTEQDTDSSASSSAFESLRRWSVGLASEPSHAERGQDVFWEQVPLYADVMNNDNP